MYSDVGDILEGMHRSETLKTFKENRVLTFLGVLLRGEEEDNLMLDDDQT